MSCPDIVDLEQYALSDEAEPADTAVADHVSKCPDCSQQVAELIANLRLAPALRLDRLAPSASEPDAAPVAPPQRIGPYQVLRNIGQGGMGSVYEARQDNPRRAVALKMIRPGLVSPALLARFRHEAQVLGRLRHPGIAQIYEAGTHHLPGAGPQPYFAMELVHGPTLIEYARSRRLTVRQRLELIARVCDAVHHAHQRGVIHRDLKPENILIDDSSGEAQPKILDFGVARVVDPEGQTTTLHTSVGQIVGTIAYMSPEQAGADPAEVDTRSDVYALGVICYELLAGRLPYRLKAASVAESVRVIVQDDPTPLATVDRSLRGDVNTIVGKAMEKEKSRRYQSAAEMAADLRRHLRDEPIAAHAPSTIYQLGKFARRNKGLVAGVVCAFALLIVAIIGTTIGMVQAQRARAAADRSAQQAQREAAKQAAVNEFLQEMISSANPRKLSAQDRAKGRNVTVLEALGAAAERVEQGSLDDQPEIEIAVRKSVGIAYSELGEYAPAGRHLEAALRLARGLYGPEHKEVADALNSLSLLRREEGKASEAEDLARQALEIAREALGAEHPDVATAMNSLAMLLQDAGKLPEAEALLRESLRLRRRHYGEQSREAATLLNNLARLLDEQGKLAEAEALYRQALRIRRQLLGDEHTDVASVLNNMGFVLRGQGKLDEAEEMFRQSLEVRRKLLGEGHPLVALGLNNLGSLLQAQRRFDQAEILYRQALQVQINAHGEEHPAVATTINNLATLIRDRGNLAEAEPVFRQALELRRRTLGDDHPAVALGLSNLGSTIRDLGRAQEAEPLFRQALAISIARLGDDHADTAGYRTHLGACLIDLARYEEAERELLQARDRYERSQLPPGDRRVESCNRHLARLYQALDQPARAAAYAPATRPAEK